MCKVVLLRFECDHHVWVRKSMCGGTYSRPGRSGVKAACSSDAYILINLPHECGTCQHSKWDGDWALRLARAQYFRDQLIEKQLRFVLPISDLVEDLKQEYDQEAWEMRTIYPSSIKSKFGRVKLGLKDTGSSPLKQEVLPEDVFDEPRRPPTPEEEDPDHVVLDAHGYPVHFTGSYENPLFNSVPDSGIYEAVAEDVEPGFDADQEFNSGWGWNNDQATGSINDDGLTAWGPDVGASSSSSGLVGMEGQIDQTVVPEQREYDKALEAVIWAFWEVVNGREIVPRASHRSTSASTSQNEDDHFPSQQDYDWNDGAGDTRSPMNIIVGPSNSALRMMTQANAHLSGSNTLTKYDKWRMKIAPKITSEDYKRRRFCYWNWLQVARWEIRKVARCYIQEPNEI
ncbi:hypothetical protein BDV96DRAFT_601979 [Lophiotrema nucula]|uniref:Uncharacterized protein n=1 Tax=Lophiotrema nucula TaxID=690887 RepID=A0A6A5YZM4_9PLEO|nr:hypothetical protein BDV96DRAFT_601979 [Lophiotrema nucula]